MAWVQSHPQGSSENLKAGLAGGRVQTRESRKLGRGEVQEVEMQTVLLRHVIWLLPASPVLSPW